MHRLTISPVLLMWEFAFILLEIAMALDVEFVALAVRVVQSKQRRQYNCTNRKNFVGSKMLLIY
jgi:hypothetical protein